MLSVEETIRVLMFLLMVNAAVAAAAADASIIIIVAVAVVAVIMCYFFPSIRLLSVHSTKTITKYMTMCSHINQNVHLLMHTRLYNI